MANYKLIYTSHHVCVMVIIKPCLYTYKPVSSSSFSITKLHCLPHFNLGIVSKHCKCRRILWSKRRTSFDFFPLDNVLLSRDANDLTSSWQQLIHAPPSHRSRRYFIGSEDNNFSQPPLVARDHVAKSSRDCLLCSV